jgi:acyl-CoA synthetase (AMP-forming)/AMP-acid ligase II
VQYTLADFIGMNAWSYPDRPALDIVGSPELSLSYGGLWRRVSDIADAIRSSPAGGGGGTVATMLPNGADALLSYLACQVARASSVPVNTRLAHAEVLHILGDSGASLILSAAPYLEAARAAAAELPGVVVVDCDTIATGGVLRDHPEADPAKGGEQAAVFYTSGTTGSPKGAAMSNETWLFNSMRWGWQLGLGWNDTMLVPGPIFHMSYGSFALCTLMIGGAVRIMTSFDAGVANEEFAQRCTCAFLVPSMTTMMLDRWQADGRPPLSRMRTMMTSGAALAPELLDPVFEMFPNATVMETYGWTEAGFATYELKTRESAPEGTVGWPCIGCEIGIFDEDGAPCGPGERGEVGVRTAMSFTGYLNRPDATAAARKGDFVMSGDVGIREADGRLRIVDRKHGMIISGGENVYPAEVERVVLQHPGVHDVAVVARPDDKWGEIVVAVVVPSPGVELEPDEVQRFCRTRLADYKSPRLVLVWDDLPRNSMGKLQRFAVRDAVAIPADSS